MALTKCFFLTTTVSWIIPTTGHCSCSAVKRRFTKHTITFVLHYLTSCVTLGMLLYFKPQFFVCKMGVMISTL